MGGTHPHRKPVFPQSCFCFLGLSVALAGCGGGPSSAEKKAADKPASTAVVPAARKKLARIVEVPGSVAAWEETVLHAKVAGYVSRVAVDIGQKVRGPRRSKDGRTTEPGEVLVELLVPELNEEHAQKLAVVRQAAAEVEQSRKALAAAEAAVVAAQSQVVEAKAGELRGQANYERWLSEFARMKKMVGGGVIDTQTSEEAQNQLRSAEAMRNETRAHATAALSLQAKSAADRDKANADVATALAKADVGKADVRRVEAMLEYTRIRAPYDGVVTRRDVNTGDLLQGGTSKDGVASVARLDPVRVVAFVPEGDAGLIDRNLKVELLIPALGASPLKATVSRTSWSLDPGARTLRTEFDVPNAAAALRPGMYVLARIAAELPEEWTMPASAVAKQGEAMVCFLVVGGKATRTPVRVGRADGKLIQVLKLQTVGDPPGWRSPTADDRFAATATGLTDGQSIEAK